MIAMGAAPRWPLRIYFNEVVEVEALQKREHKCKVGEKTNREYINTHRPSHPRTQNHIIRFSLYHNYYSTNI